jgi:hypothetical protein
MKTILLMLFRVCCVHRKKYINTLYVWKNNIYIFFNINECGIYREVITYVDLFAELRFMATGEQTTAGAYEFCR